jgi:hypothetical protein
MHLSANHDEKQVAVGGGNREQGTCKPMVACNSPAVFAACKATLCRILRAKKTGFHKFEEYEIGQIPHETN